MSDRYVAQYNAGRTVAALHVLSQRRRSTSELAQELGVSQQTARRLIVRLIDDGLVEADPRAARSFRIAAAGHGLGFLLLTSALRELHRRDTTPRSRQPPGGDHHEATIADAAADPLEQLGLNIRSRRKALNLTAEQTGLRIGMDPSYLSRIERSVVDPGVKTLTRIATALETRPADLLAGVDGSERDR
jgi:DNA-binding Xre family transcriptional regulator